MPTKYGSCVINSHINDVWSNNLIFWDKNKGKVKNQIISKNGLYRAIKVRHKMSMKAYGMSTGETYTFNIAYNPDNNITHALIDVKYSMFGKGAVWKFPNDLMKKWAQFMGIEPVKLSFSKDLNYQNVSIEIDRIRYEKEYNEKQNFCPLCGFENSFENKKCVNCNSELE